MSTREISDITYTLIFSIFPDKSGKPSSINLAHVWDLATGQTVSNFELTEALSKSAEEQFNKLRWDYSLNEDGQVNEEAGYCYYSNSNPDELSCSNDLRR